MLLLEGGEVQRQQHSMALRCVGDKLCVCGELVLCVYDGVVCSGCGSLGVDGLGDDDEVEE